MSNNLLPKPKLIFLSMTSCHERSLEIKWCINENFRWGIENKKHLNWFSVKWALPTDGKMSDIIMFIPRSWSNPILKWPHESRAMTLNHTIYRSYLFCPWPVQDHVVVFGLDPSISRTVTPLDSCLIDI